MEHRTTANRAFDSMVSKEKVREPLPKVGDRRMEIPTIAEDNGYNTKPMPCVVVRVNWNHFWYTVQFENGTRESYKLPRRKPAGGAAK